MKTWRVVVVAAVALALAACGSTSRIRPAAAVGQPAPLQLTPELVQGYPAVAVVDFEDATQHARIRADRRAEHIAAVDRATRDFADRIAAEIRETGVFSEVRREQGAGKVLVVGGRITRFREGSGAARFFIGFGAGSSFFDATVVLRDGESGQVLGEILVDRNSWPLGGVVAATQTVERFMSGAAKKTAAELEALKEGEARE